MGGKIVDTPTNTVFYCICKITNIAVVGDIEVACGKKFW